VPDSEQAVFTVVILLGIALFAKLSVTRKNVAGLDRLGRERENDDDDKRQTS